jgi:hypothetical protein
MIWTDLFTIFFAQFSSFLFAFLQTLVEAFIGA